MLSEQKDLFPIVFVGKKIFFRFGSHFVALPVPKGHEFKGFRKAKIRLKIAFFENGANIAKIAN